jgi:hypothetical protein
LYSPPPSISVCIPHLHFEIITDTSKLLHLLDSIFKIRCGIAL